MQIQVANKSQASIINDLLQLYLHDLSEYCEIKMNSEGLFEYDYLDSYWLEPNRIPLLIMNDNICCGFALINDHIYYKDINNSSIAEFFILKEYRNQGLGQKAISMIFDQFPNNWEIRVIENNKPANMFWNKVISTYTKDSFTKNNVNDDFWKGTIYSFSNVTL